MEVEAKYFVVVKAGDESLTKGVVRSDR